MRLPKGVLFGRLYGVERRRVAAPGLPLPLRASFEVELLLRAHGGRLLLFGRLSGRGELLSSDRGEVGSSRACAAEA